MTEFIRADFDNVSMQYSLLTKATFLLEHWNDVDISMSKIYDMDMQETKDSGLCILGYQPWVWGEPTRLLDGYFTVNMSTVSPKKFIGTNLKRISNSSIEENISKSNTLIGFFSRALGFGSVDYYDKDYYQWLHKELDKFRKS